MTIKDDEELIAELHKWVDALGPKSLDRDKAPFRARQAMRRAAERLSALTSGVPKDHTELLKKVQRRFTEWAAIRGGNGVYGELIDEIEAALSRPEGEGPENLFQDELAALASAPEIEDNFTLPQPQRRKPTLLPGEGLEVVAFPGVDSQVMTDIAQRCEDDEYQNSPAWLWFGEDGTSFGRWNKGEQVAYVRGDIATVTLAAATTLLGEKEVEIERLQKARNKLTTERILLFGIAQEALDEADINLEGNEQAIFEMIGEEIKSAALSDGGA